MSLGKAAVIVANRKPAVEAAGNGDMVHRGGALPLPFYTSVPALEAALDDLIPGIDAFAEPMDPRDAERADSTNRSVLRITRGMLTRVIKLLK